MKNLNEIKEFIIKKTNNNAKAFSDKLPSYTIDGRYNFVDDCGWVGSFWTGLNWLCYEFTGDSSFVDNARISRHRFEDRLYNNPNSLDHDLGFLFVLSSIADYKLTGDLKAKQTAIDASKALMKRYNENGRFIQAWNVWQAGDPFCEDNKGRIIVDCMYNLPLLFWDNHTTGNQKAKEIAKAHADTNGRHLVRADYSTYHTFVFDPQTGLPKFGQTCQGYADRSCWSRGQAWTLGGYAYAYRETEVREYLIISKNCADYFIDNLEDDYIPMWDFSFRHCENEERDSSAAAIAACGLIELAAILGNEGEKYLNVAKKIVTSLYESYSTKDDESNQGLILHACGNKPASSVDADCSLIFGDYYFAEAVAKLSNSTINYWR